MMLEVRDLAYSYGGRSGWELADVSFAIPAGTSVGIVGESGSGKSTVVRILCGLQELQRGDVRFAGEPLQDWLSQRAREFRRRNQFVFQDPASSFDPRMRLGSSLAEPVKALERRSPSTDELAAWIEEVGLPPEMLRRYPHQLSGGQLQRMAIARALSVSPDILYADEPTSALDVSVQAQVLNVLMELRRSRNLTLVLVSHDLAIVSHVCDSVIVMRNGRVEETGPAASVLGDPGTPYTQELVDAAMTASLT
jgi:ABC-type dipeptide/oligopeptide/nickel transport system ATPase subunit